MKIQNIVYTEKIEGKDKPKYHTCGILMTKDDGKQSIKITTLPVGSWNGWFNVFDQKEQDTKKGPTTDSSEPF